MLYLNRFRRKPAILSLIRLSLLTTNHPSIFLHTRVRSFYNIFIFNLFIVRSLNFGLFLVTLFLHFKTQCFLAYILKVKLATINKLIDPLCKRYAVLFYKSINRLKTLNFN